MLGLHDSSAECGLRLQGYRGARYTLTFEEFDTEAGNDVLAIYDGSTDAAPLLGRFSGAALPPSLTSAEPNLYLLFISNDNTEAGGFTLKYTCSGDPVEYWKPSDVATNLQIARTVHDIPPSGHQTACLAGVLMGVQCCADANTDCAAARVTGFSLSGQSLRGHIPEMIGSFGALKSLLLHDNFL
eukprot:SAG22_NODE_420_length_10739_cov_7.090320_7_plen_185_part_00